MNLSTEPAEADEYEVVLYKSHIDYVEYKIYSPFKRRWIGKPKRSKVYDSDGNAPPIAWRDVDKDLPHLQRQIMEKIDRHKRDNAVGAKGDKRRVLSVKSDA